MIMNREKIQANIYNVICILYVLCLFFFENIASAVPYLSTTSYLAIGFALLFFKIDVIYRSVSKQQNGIIHKNLANGLNYLTNQSENIDTLYIFASSSAKIIPTFSSSALHIKHCKIILCQMQGTKPSSTPYNKRVALYVNEWYELQRSGIIEDLKIGYTYTTPTHYIVLMDKRFCLTGTYNCRSECSFDSK